MAVIVDQGMMSLGTFIVGVLVARAISTEQYGVFVLGWSLVAIVLGVQRAIVVLPFTVYSPRMSSEERGRHLGSGLLHTLVIGLVAIVVFLVMAWEAPRKPGKAGLVMALPLIALVIVPNLLREQMRSAAIAQLNFIGSAKANIAASCLMLTAAAALYTENLLTLESSYLVIGGSSLFAAMLLIYRQWVTLRITPSAFIFDFLCSIRIGKWILVNVFAFTLASQIFPWLIQWSLDTSQVGAYGACFAVAGVLNPFLRGINAYSLPRMTHGYKDSHSGNLFRIMRKTVLVVAIPYGIWIVLGSVFAEDIMQLLYNGKYAGHRLLVGLLILRTAIESISTPLISALQTMERPDITTSSMAIGAITGVTAGILLVQAYGLPGAGLAAVLSSLSSSAWRLLCLKKLYRERNT